MVCSLEQKLAAVDLVVGVPVLPHAVRVLLLIDHVLGRDRERNRLVRLGGDLMSAHPHRGRVTHYKVLDGAVGHLALLLEGAHESAAWPDPGLDLGQRDGEE